MIDLILHNDNSTPHWSLGHVWSVGSTPAAVARTIQNQLEASKSEACLFWDSALGSPDPNRVIDTLHHPGDIWHAGLRLGMGGLPGMIDFVDPTWMLNLDPPIDRVATSWRLSIQACLIRSEVLRQLGGCDPNFDSLAGASLDMGYRYINRGAFVRHIPELLPSHVDHKYHLPPPSIYDELRFIQNHYGIRWVYWSLLRSLVNGYPPAALLKAYLRLGDVKPFPIQEPYKRGTALEAPYRSGNGNEKITVLIPTLDRYSYLRNELAQLECQTHTPHEIMIMDQTPAGQRDTTLSDDFPDLPIRFYYQNKTGQCTGWNHGLLASSGEYVLFLGDDADEIEPTFLEKFIHTFHSLQVDMVASLVDEIGVDPVPSHLAFMRIADTFPIAMIRRSILQKTGLMDYAFDHGTRADADLGLRCCLAGALMVLNPEIRVLHHRAPRGGLRAHKARTITRASSRRSLIKRQLPTYTEIYLAKRYFTPRQLREMLWLKVSGTFSIKDSVLKKILKIFIGFTLLPHTLWVTSREMKRATEMLQNYPQIPFLIKESSIEEPVATNN